MKFHVITPLARFENIQKLIDMLQPMGIEWIVITDEDSNFTFDLSSYEWIKHYVCPNTAFMFYERCNFAINWFLDNHVLVKNEMYCILNDDDAYEPDFFSKIDSALSSIELPVLITSMERGHQIPASAVGCRAHPPTKLWGIPENMRVGGVGVEQIILKGEILSKFRIPLLNDGDGRFIVSVLHEYGAACIPDVNVWFNYFEPGRWDNIRHQ